MPEIIVEPAWRQRLDALLGRRRDAWVLGAVVGTVVLGAIMMWSRGAPAAIAPPAIASPGASPSSGEVVLVHIAGAVRRPGLYELPLGARVADALDAAGGPKRTADLDALNLAQVLVDGLKIDVVPVGAPAPASSDNGSGQLVSINSADVVALESVPGIGPVKAEAIVAYRGEIGAFASLDELMNVSGIGPATLETIRPYLTL